MCIIITADVGSPGPIMISRPEQFRNETVAVFAKWRVEENYEMIIPSVSPQVTVDANNGTSAQLILNYNTLYNVSVTATLCGRSLSSSTTNLFYGRSLYCLNQSVLHYSMLIQLNVILL